MELDAPSVRGAFTINANGRPSVNGFSDLFDLGPSFPLNLNGALHGGPAPLQLPAAAGRQGGGGLPAALQPAPEELMRFGGAGMQLGVGAPMPADGGAMLPPMHIIEG